MSVTRDHQVLCADAPGAQGTASWVLPSVSFEGSVAPAGVWLQRLTDLLGCDPIELSRVCDEIRLHPGLEALVIRLSRSLLLSPDAARTTIEEASVQLGVDRLRILVRAWVSSRALAGDGAGSQAIQRSPEALYVEAFLHALGLNVEKSEVGRGDSPSFAGMESEQRAELADVLVRDILSLIQSLGSRESRELPFRFKAETSRVRGRNVDEADSRPDR